MVFKFTEKENEHKLKFLHDLLHIRLIRTLSIFELCSKDGRTVLQKTDLLRKRRSPFSEWNRGVGWEAPVTKAVAIRPAIV